MLCDIKHPLLFAKYFKMSPRLIEKYLKNWDRPNSGHPFSSGPESVATYRITIVHVLQKMNNVCIYYSNNEKSSSNKRKTTKRGDSHLYPIFGLKYSACVIQRQKLSWTLLSTREPAHMTIKKEIFVL